MGVQKSLACEQNFYGSVTVGERGQIVIPAEARSSLGYAPGDKLLVLHHPVHNGLMVFKLEEARQFLDEMANRMNAIEESFREEEI